jgi:hypothetical protein
MTPRTEQLDRMGIESREPVGAVLRVGQKNPKSGNPMDNDKFFICRPQSTQHAFTKRGGGTFNAPLRELHPDFSKYNKADSAQRAIFRGTFVHATVEEIWRLEYRAISAGIGGSHPVHPDFLPNCSSKDGKVATRLYRYRTKGIEMPKGVTPVDGKPIDEEWGMLKCPAEDCTFRRQGPRCKVSSWLYFLPRWVGEGGGYFPEVLMRWHTGSGANASALRGFFDQTDEWARQIGLQSYSLMGLPFVLNLTMVTSRKAGTRFPLVSISHDGEISEFFARQAERLQLAQGAARSEAELLLPVSATTDDEDAITVDAVDIEPAVPASLPTDDTGQGKLL